MNFFEQQDRARRQSRWLIIVFIVAVLAIVVAIDLLILLAAGVSSIETEGAPLLSPQLFADNLPLLTGGAIATYCHTIAKINTQKRQGSVFIL